MKRNRVLKDFFHYAKFAENEVSADLLDLLRNPEPLLNDERTTILQNNFKSKIGVVSFEGRTIAIKRHNYKSGWHKFKRLFRKTRASRSWFYSQRLRSDGILVPTPLGYVESRIGPLRLDSYFFYEYVAGISGNEFFQIYSEDPDKIQNAINSIVDLLSKLHTLGLIHGDIRIANMIFRDDRFWLLDFDDMRPATWFKPLRVRKRDIRGLRKDIHYNVPGAIQNQFFARLDELESSMVF